MRRFDFEEAFFEGRDLSKLDAEQLERELLKDPANLVSRVKLIGYYHLHQYCCFRAIEWRRPHLVWAVNNLEFKNPRISGFFDIDIEDSETYRQLIENWRHRLREASTDYLIWCSLAHFQEVHEPEEADSAYQHAFQLNPENEILLELYQSFRERKADLLKRAERKSDFTGIHQIPLKLRDGSFCSGNPRSPL